MNLVLLMCGLLKKPVQTPSRNIVRGRLPGLLQSLKDLGNHTHMKDVWTFLFDSEMVDQIVASTHQKLKSVCCGLSDATKKSSNYKNTEKSEINSHIGLQLIASIIKTN